MRLLGGRLLLATLAHMGCSVGEPSAADNDALRPGYRCNMSRAVRGSGDIATDRQGNLFVATGPRHRGEGPASTIRKIDKNGRDVWTYSVPDGDELLPLGVATDASGAVIVVGRGFRTKWLPNGVEDIQTWLFLLKLDPSGQLELRHDFAGSGYFAQVAAAPGGDIFVYGRYSSMLDLGGGPMPDSGGPSTSFIAKFGSTGKLLWTKDFGNPDAQAPLAIATDGTGALFVTGRLMAPFDFGGGPLIPTPNTDPADDIPMDAFLVKYDASGDHAWSKRFGGNGIQVFRDITTDAAGNAVVLGYNLGEMQLGGTHYVEHADIVTAFNPQGEPLFGRALPTPWGNAERIAVSASGEMFVAGTFLGTLNLDGTPLASAGGSDLFVVRLDPRGAAQTSVRLGGAGNDYLWGLAVNAAGGVTLGGDFQGALNFGCGSLAAGPDADAFVAGLML